MHGSRDQMVFPKAYFFFFFFGAKKCGEMSNLASVGGSSPIILRYEYKAVINLLDNFVVVALEELLKPSLHMADVMEFVLFSASLSVQPVPVRFSMGLRSGERGGHSSVCSRNGEAHCEFQYAVQTIKTTARQYKTRFKKNERMEVTTKMQYNRQFSNLRYFACDCRHIYC